MALKNLFDNYKEFEEIIKNKSDDEIDLANIELNPTAILPLLCVCKNDNLKFNGKNAHNYLINILKENRLFSKLPLSRIESDETDFITEYMENLDSQYGSYFALRHIISELANNVYDHAKKDYGLLNSYIYSKINHNSKKLDISVADDGLSIPGLFDLANVDFKNDCHALEKAIGSFSTVSDTFYERGNGLKTIARIVIEGNGGEILIISRNGSLYINGEHYNYHLFDDEEKFNWTLVSVRLNRYEIQNIYQLLEPTSINPYKYGVNDDY